MDLGPLFDWVKDQAQYIIMAAVIIVGIVLAFRRQWIALIASIFVIAVIGIFIIMPETVLNLAEWLNGKVNIGNQ